MSHVTRHAPRPLDGMGLGPTCDICTLPLDAGPGVVVTCSSVTRFDKLALAAAVLEQEVAT